MAAVWCPHCKAMLRSGPLAPNARVRCPRCGNAFILAGQKDAKDKLPSAASGIRDAADDRLLGQRPSDLGVRKRPSGPFPWQFPALVAGLLGVVALAVAIAYYSGHPLAVSSDGQAQRVSWEDLQKTRQDLDASLRQVDAPAKGDDRAAGQPAPAALRPVRKDPAIRVDGIAFVPGALAGRGCLVGVVHNDRRETIRSLKVGLVIPSPDGGYAFSRLAECQYVPPGGSARFSVDCAGLTKEDLAKVDWTTRDVQADDQLVCWEIDPELVRRSVEGSQVVLEGTTRNTAGRDAWDVLVFCDFFTAEDAYLGSVLGSLLDRRRLRVGQDGPFAVRLETQGTGVSPQLITKFSLRAIGARSARSTNTMIER